MVRVVHTNGAGALAQADAHKSRPLAISAKSDLIAVFQENRAAHRWATRLVRGHCRVSSSKHPRDSSLGPETVPLPSRSPG